MGELGEPLGCLTATRGSRNSLGQMLLSPCLRNSDRLQSLCGNSSDCVQLSMGTVPPWSRTGITDTLPRALGWMRAAHVLPAAPMPLGSAPLLPRGCGAGLATSSGTSTGTRAAVGREQLHPGVGPPAPRPLAYHRVPVDVDLPLLGPVGDAAAPQALAAQALLRQLLCRLRVDVGCGGREPWGGGTRGAEDRVRGPAA